MANNKYQGMSKEEKDNLRNYYAANITWLKEQLARTDITEEKKRHLAITEERLQDFVVCRNELNESCVSGWGGDEHPQNW